jgi:hypothetical protein
MSASRLVGVFYPLSQFLTQFSFGRQFLGRSVYIPSTAADQKELIGKNGPQRAIIYPDELDHDPGEGERSSKYPSAERPAGPVCGRGPD